MTADAPVTLQLPHLYDKQRQAIFTDKRWAVVEASTKSGKTAGCLVWIIGEAWERGKPGRNFWWVAPIFPQAKIAYRRGVRMLAKADPKKTIWKTNESELWIELASGGRIWFKGSDKPDSLYGEDVFAAVIDEGTRCKEEAWYAVRTTLSATRGPLRIISNVKGRKNWVYRLARRAQAGDPDMSYAKLTAYDAVEGGILHFAEVEDAKRMLPEHVFRELYLAEPSDDGGNPFGIDAIGRCVGHLGDPREIVAWGVDLAKSQDWTVPIGLDKSGRVCAYQRWQSDWRNTEARLVAMLGSTPALVDSTGVGDAVVEQLQAKCPLVEGYKFTSLSKQQLMEGLASAIHQKRVTYPEGPIVAELEAFEYEYTRNGVRYTAPEGMHDDCVDSLALAMRCLTTRPAPFQMSYALLDDDDDEVYSFLDDEDIWTDL